MARKYNKAHYLKQKLDNPKYKEILQELEKTPITGNKRNSISNLTLSPTKTNTQAPSLPTLNKLDTSSSGPIKKEDESWWQGWFKKGALEDGYDFGDVTKTILGTKKDLISNLKAGVIEMPEKAIDFGATLLGGGAKLFGFDDFADKTKNFVKSDLIDSEKLSKAITNPVELGKRSGKLVNEIVTDKKDLSKSDIENIFFDNYFEKNSILDEKSDSLLQSAGQLAATYGLSMAGVPWWLTTGTTSFGGEVENAFKNDARYDEAIFSGLVTAGAELLTEKISGGISFGGKTLDKGLKSVVTKKISNKAVSNLIKFGLDATGEGFEEVASEFLSTLGQQLSYEREETWNELLNNEEAMDKYIEQVANSLFGEEARANYTESFIGGAVLGGGANVGKVITSNVTGKDYDTGLTTDETIVVEAETNRRIEAQEKTGKKLTAKEKAKIEEEVTNEVLEKFSNKTTEEIAPTNNTIQNTQETVEDIDNQIIALEEQLEKTEDDAEYERIRQQISELEDRANQLEQQEIAPVQIASTEQISQPTTQQVETNLPTDVVSNTQNIETNPKRRNFTYDSTKITNEYTQATYESASKVMNDTEHSHKFVDVVAKIATEKNTKYEFTNNEDIKSRGYDIEGKQVNGLVTVEENGKTKILINIDSPKALNTIVGHETTHLLEGTKEYNELQEAIFEYAKSKGEFNDRQAKLHSLYKNVKGANVNNELTADLVGDYLFTDSKFIESLSVEKPTLFQKLKELIDDLVVKFKGTKEEKQLREVQNKFREAYRQNVTDKKTGTKFSIGGLEAIKSLPDSKFKRNALEDYEKAQTMAKNNIDNETIRQETQWFQDKKGDWKFEFTDEDMVVSKNIKANSTYKLGDIVEHKLLYHLYPELKNFTVKTMDMKGPASISPSDKTIRINNRILNKEVTLKTSLLHEIQHAIQEKEGFTQGTTSLLGKRRYARNLGEIEADDTARRYNLTKEERKQIAPESSKENPIHPEYEKILDMRSSLEKKLDELYDFVRGESNEIVEISEENKNGNNTMVESRTNMGVSRDRGRNNGQELDDSSFFNTKYSISDNKGRELTKEQQDYFKDSKVRDEDGNLVTVYHGTNEEFNIFDRNLIDEETMLAEGFYFTKDKTHAEAYGNSQKEVYLDIKNPIRIPTISTYGLATAIYNTKTTQSIDIIDRDYGVPSTKKMTDYLMSNGYDGIITDDGNYVVFNSNQIKNVDNTNPTSNEDIRYSISEETSYRGSHQIDNAKKITELDLNDIQNKVIEVSGYLSKQDHSDLNKLKKIFKAPNETVKIYRASPVNELNSGDWVTTDKAYAKNVANENGGKVYEYEVKPSQLYYPDNVRELPSLHRLSSFQFIEENIRNSLSEQNENIAPTGDYNVYGEDVKLQEAIAPLQQEIQTLTETIEDLKEQIAPVKEDIDRPTTMDDLEGWEAQTREVAENQDIAPVRNNLTIEESQELEMLEDIPFNLTAEEQARKNELEMKERNSYYMNDTMTLDKKSLKALSKNIKDSLGLNNKQKLELENVIQEYSMQENASREDLYEIIENRFGKQNVETKLDNIIDAQTTIRRSKIKPTDDLRQMTDYFQTKQRNFGRISMSNNGMEIDKVYQELSETYKDLFPDTITNPADQFERIIEVANMSKTSLEEITLPEDVILDVTDFIYESVQDYKYSEYVKNSNSMYEDGWENINIPFEEVNDTDIAPVLKVSSKLKPKTTNKNVDWEALEDTSKGTQQQFNSETMELEDTVEKKTKKQIKQELLQKTGIMNESLDEANKLPKMLMENTDPIRLQEMIFGRALGNDINKMFFQKVKDNTSNKIRFQNKERAEIKELGIKARSKESAAVQKYGEKQWTNDAGEVIPYGDKELASEFPNVETQKKIKRASEIIRQKYDSYLDTTNKVLTDLGYDAIPKRKDYMRHFQELNDIFSRVGIPYNYNEMTANDLPTDINGLTADFSPSKNFFASALHRKGVKTTYDAITGIDGYLEGIGNLIYHTEDIQRLRAYEQYIRDTYGENHGFDNLENLSDEEKVTRIEKIQDNHLSNYAAWLHEYTNTLAGKKAMIDRSVESLTGRRIYSFLNTTKSQVGKNMIGFNLSSALTNVIAEVQALAKTNKLATVKGFSDTIKNVFVKDGFVEKNNFLTSRMGSDMLSKNLWQRAGDAGFIFMQGTDNFISQLIVRSKYNEFKMKGYTDKQAHAEAGKFASRIMGDRSQGATANIYNSQMLGLVTQFQLEVNNQLYSMFYDTYHESKESAKGNATKTAIGMTYTLGQLAVLTHLFGAGFEAMAGYNPTFDIIGMLMTAFGFDDDEEEKDTAGENISQAVEKLVDALPYVNILTGGGRIPVSEALPLKELFTGKDEYGNNKSRSETLKEALPYYVLPTGYGQIKKTTKGLGMYDEDLPIAGSYTDSGNLRFTAEEDTWSKIQAAIFGQWANDEAQAYVDSEFKTINKNNVDELIDLGMTSSEYRKYKSGLSKQKSVEDKIEYINDLDVTDEQKSIMANNVLKRDYNVDMGEYDDFGSYEEFDFSYKNPEKYEWFKENGISYEDYSYNKDSKEIYNYAYNNPEIYKTGKAITNDFEKYMEYKDYIYDLKADKDSEGKSISGTRKAKVISYVNELDLTIPQKAMLIRQEYSTFDDYNYDIVEYVDNLDIDYDDKVSILESLEMKVSEDGTISWE